MADSDTGILRRMCDRSRHTVSQARARARHLDNVLRTVSECVLHRIAVFENSQVLFDPEDRFMKIGQ